MWLRGAWMLPLALHILLPAVCAMGDSRQSVKMLMVEELRNSPANRDAFAHVPKAQRHLWEHDDGRNINEALQSFSDIPVDVVIAVKLIAFDGDGINHARVSESELLKHLGALQLDTHLTTAVLEPHTRHLSARPRVHFLVSKAPPSLTQKLAGVLTAAVFEGKQATRSPHSTLYLPHTLVDDVLAEEERAAAATAASPSSGAHHGKEHTTTTGSSGSGSGPPLLTLYVLNLEPPSGTDYLYAYQERPELVATGNWSEFQSCPGALFVSTARGAAGAGFAWVDLGAAPHAYGPLRGGHGQVFPHSLPHASSFQPDRVSIALLPELAALAASAVRHLAWPPLQHADVALPGRGQGGDTLTVQVVHIHDTLAVPPRSVDLEVLKSELSSALAGSPLRVEVREAYLSFSMCDLCVNAYSSALRVRTQRQEGSTVVAAAGQILDRQLLHRTLREYDEVILAYAGVHDTAGVLPVFVFDLSMRDEALLLDGALQAAAFPDMVVAVASLASPVRSRFSCGHMPLSIHPEDVTRAVLGGILQSAFGVAHTAQRYHPASGAGWDYLWSLGATPFGPLSQLAGLSAPGAAAVGRNMAAAELERQAGRIAAVLRGLSQLSPRAEWSVAVPHKDLRLRLLARLNVASLKVQMAAAALARAQGADALRLAHQIAPDATAIERVALQLQAGLLARLECRTTHTSKGVVRGWLSSYGSLVLPPLGSLAALAMAGWWRSRGARLRAEARYDRIY